MNRVCLKFLKVYDGELCKKFNFDFEFRMENNVFNLNKQLVVI